jgi:hypothetical protein
MKAVDQREPNRTELQTYTIEEHAVALLVRLRESEPQLSTIQRKPLPIEEMSLARLLPIAPTAVLGTLLPYAQSHGTTCIGERDIRMSFATTHAITVADADELTTSFRLGIRITAEQDALFTYIHTLTPATVSNGMIMAINDNHTVHQGLCDPHGILPRETFVALHCGSVICALSESEAYDIVKSQQQVQHLFGKLPPSIDYTHLFNGVFVSKAL